MQIFFKNDKNNKCKILFYFIIGEIKQRRNDSQNIIQNHQPPDVKNDTKGEKAQWKRILLLIIAITVHNIPGKIN